MTPQRVKRGLLWVLKHTLNRVTSRVARPGRRPFSPVRHVARRTGRIYETPLILARVENGVVAELTSGPEVSWYRTSQPREVVVIVSEGARALDHQHRALPDPRGTAGLRIPGRGHPHAAAAA